MRTNDLVASAVAGVMTKAIVTRPQQYRACHEFSLFQCLQGLTNGETGAQDDLTPCPQ